MDFSRASCGAMLRPSIAIIKRNGDSGSPCLTPLESGNSMVGEPFTKTEAQAEAKQPETHDLHLHPNPIFSIIESR